MHDTASILDLCHTEENIKKFIGYSLRENKAGDDCDYYIWRGYAWGAYLIWDDLTQGSQKEGDDERLLDLIPDNE